MKVKVKRVFFDDNGLHKVGEVVEVSAFDADLMEHDAEEVKADARKTKKGVAIKR